MDCGGDKRVVCDTQAWSSDSDSGWLNVWIVVDDSIQTYDVIKERAFRYYASSNSEAPRLTRAEPRHLAAGDVLTLYGDNFGASASRPAFREME